MSLPRDELARLLPCGDAPWGPSGEAGLRWGWIKGSSDYNALDHPNGPIKASAWHFPACLLSKRDRLRLVIYQLHVHSD